MEFDVNIGLEIHAQLKTETKLFCRCRNQYGAEPNSLTCPVCLGLPGALPALNRKAVDAVIKLGIATNCQIADTTYFDRKNYFYPDLPKGYQITQQRYPLCRNGFIQINNTTGKTVKIERIHLEEDAGKSLHTDSATLLDFNRCGTPLAEIVTGPQLSNPAEAAEFLTKIRQLLEYLDICDGNMAKGSLRCDANISVKPAQSAEMGRKVEIKNMNSIRNVQRALEYEINRQNDRLNRKKQIVRETRYWNDKTGTTISMRSKEESPDYRYFPEPDLPMLRIDSQWIDRCRQEIPELPAEKVRRFREEYHLKPEDCEILTRDRTLADYFENVNALVQRPELVGKWIINEILKVLKTQPKTLLENALNPHRFAEFLNGIISLNIPHSAAKNLFTELLDPNRSVDSIINKKNNGKPLGRTIKEVVQNNPVEWGRFIRGEDKLMNYFIGEVMKNIGGDVDPKSIISELQTLRAKESS